MTMYKNAVTEDQLGDEVQRLDINKAACGWCCIL